MAAGATLDIGGFTQRVNSLAGTGTVTNSGGAPVALIVGTNGVSTADTTFSGIIQDGNAALRLEISTSGNLTLTGNNTYTGGTQINSSPASHRHQRQRAGYRRRDCQRLKHATDHRQHDDRQQLRPR